jgi:hypothetical protein
MVCFVGSREMTVRAHRKDPRQPVAKQFSAARWKSEHVAKQEMVCDNGRVLSLDVDVPA